MNSASNQKQGNEGYVNNAIAKFQNDKKLLEFQDKMNPASSANYARLHANSKDDRGEKGRRVYSNIGIEAQDYSGGRGESNIKVNFNISPSEARYLYNMVYMIIGHSMIASRYQSTERFEVFSAYKDFSKLEGAQRNDTQSFTLVRQHKKDEKTLSKSPWTVNIKNNQKSVMVFLTDKDMCCLLEQVVAYIGQWENTCSPKLIREGRAALDARMVKAADEAGRNPKPQQQVKHQKPIQPNPAPSANGHGMTLEQAREVIISIGKHKGRPLGAVEAEWPQGIAWYVNTYTGNDQKMRQAATVIVENLDSQLKAS